MATTTKTIGSKALEGAVIETWNGLIVLVLLQLEHSCLLVPYGIAGRDTDEYAVGEVSFTDRRYYGEEPAFAEMAEETRKRLLPHYTPGSRRMFLNGGTFYTGMAFEVSTESLEKRTAKVLAKAGEAKDLHKVVAAGYRLLMFPHKCESLVKRSVDGLFEVEDIAIQVQHLDKPCVSDYGQVERRITQIKRDTWFNEMLDGVSVSSYHGLDLDELGVINLRDFCYAELVEAGMEEVPEGSYDDYWDSPAMDKAMEVVVQDFDGVVTRYAAAGRSL